MSEPADIEQFLAIGLNAIPAVVRTSEDPRELVEQAAEQFAEAKATTDYYIDNSLTRYAEDAFLDLIARDRGTGRRDGESNEVLGERLRSPEDTITPLALVRNNSLLVTIESGSDVYTAFALFFYYGNGTIEHVGSTDGYFGEENTLSWNNRPNRGDGYFKLFLVNSDLDPVSKSIYSGTGYTFTYVTGFTGGDVEDVPTAPEKPEGVITRILRAAEVEIPRGYPRLVELRQEGAHWDRSFFDRADRFKDAPPKNRIIVILPAGTDEPTRAAVMEALRTNKAGGVIHRTEVASE